MGGEGACLQGAQRKTERKKPSLTAEWRRLKRVGNQTELCAITSENNGPQNLNASEHRVDWHGISLSRHRRPNFLPYFHFHALPHVMSMTREKMRAERERDAATARVIIKVD